MKRIFNFLIISILSIVVLLLAILSTTGVETKKFNKLITKKVKTKNQDIYLILNTIKFKLDIREISLFLEAKNPSINFKEINLPVKNVKAYVNFLSLIKSENKLEKISLNFDQISIEKIKTIAPMLKPSNFSSFLNNKLVEGKLNTQVELYFNKNNEIENFITKGSIVDAKVNFEKEFNFVETNFSFFADNTDIIIKKFHSKFGPLVIEDGDARIQVSPEILIDTNFLSNIEINRKSIKELIFLDKFLNFSSLENLNGRFSNSLFINLDKTLKIKDYNYKNSGKIFKAKFNIQNSIETFLFDQNPKFVILKDTEIITSIKPNQNNINIKGKYSFNNENFLDFNTDNSIKKEILKFKINADIDENIKIDLINYLKPKKKIAEVSLEFEKFRDNLKFKYINYKEGKSSIVVDDLKFQKGKFLNLKKISIKTFSEKILNNDFTILFGNTIKIKGNKFDASNLPKILTQKKNDNNFANLNKNIEIDFVNVIAPVSKKLSKFRLIGKIEKGKFINISSKGDFGNNNFLDITMKNDELKKKKYLEIYSDITKPLLTEYSFFRGLTGGQLLYSSIIDNSSSTSKLKIENFKVVNAPGMVKLLTLADLGGLADLAKGEGISFEILEIDFEQTGELIKINEILALGPSISVLMNGYKDKSTTSLRGTLIPAKTLNKMISRIPLIGDIVIPKEVGEGLFGISFKMKGPRGQIKTSINPIKTITPRFIQKIIDKNKKIN